MAKKTRKKRITHAQKMAKWGDKITSKIVKSGGYGSAAKSTVQVYTGAPFDKPPKNFPEGVYYKVKGHPYWVVDRSSEIESWRSRDPDGGRIRGMSTGTKRLGEAKYSEPYIDNEGFWTERAKSGTYKNVDKEGPFKALFKKSGKVLRSLSPTAIIPTAVGMGLSMMPNEKAQAAGRGLLYMGDPIGEALLGGPTLRRNPKYMGALSLQERKLRDPSWRY